MLTYDEYLSGIAFRYLQPEHEPFALDRLKQFNKILQSFGYSLEATNTKLPENEKLMRIRLRGLLNMPRMSTFAMGAIINESVARMRDDCCFVNVGVWHGFTFLSGIIGNRAKQSIGIDNFSEFGGPRDEFLARFGNIGGPAHRFFEMDYRRYFSEVHSGQIGFYIYDGHHSYESQYEGLRVAEPYFASDCIILVDDTNWSAPREATLDFAKHSAHRYRLLLDRNTCTANHPTFWNGVLVLQKVD